MKTLCIVLAFFASASSLTFNCEFKEVNWLAFGLNYQCQTEAFNVEASEYVTSISGIHLPNKTIDDVIAIHIANCTNLSYIPKGLLQVFPNLLGIYLEGCGILSLTGTELNEYPKLSLFALELSLLKYVPGNLFAQTPEMVLISFAENNITGTGKNLLRNLNNLSQAYFEANICVDKNAPTTEEIPELIETLNSDCHDDCIEDCLSNCVGNCISDCLGLCSNANEMYYKSVSLMVLLSGLALFAKYNWTN